MRIAPLLALTTLWAATADADSHAVLPNCCASDYGMLTILNGATGAIENAFSTGSSPSGQLGGTYQVAATHDGKHAVVAENLYPSNGPASLALSRIELETGRITGTANIANAFVGAIPDIAVNPRTGVIYLPYIASSGGTNTGHLLVLDPETMAILRDVHDGQIGNVAVSPDGSRIYCATQSSIVVLAAASLSHIGSVSLQGQPAYLAVSPDGATLFAATLSASDIVEFIDTASLQITQTLQVAHINGLALSPDGSQLYVPNAAGLEVINTSTLSVTTLSQAAVYEAAASPDGTVYLWSGLNVEVLDPVSLMVTETYPAAEDPLCFVLDAAGNLIFLTDQANTVSMAGAPPSSAIVRSAPVGVGLWSGAYDRQDSLVLLPDSYFQHVDVLDAATLAFKGYVTLPYPGAGWAGFSEGHGYATVGVGEPANTEVVQFDPVSLAITGSVAIPFPAVDNSGYYTQPAFSGPHLFVPFNFYFDSGDTSSRGPYNRDIGIAVIDTQTMTLAGILPFRVQAFLGFVTAPGTGKGYVEVEYGSHESLLEIDLSTGATLRSAQISGTTLAISPDGGTLYLAGASLTAVSVGTFEIVNSIPALACSAVSVTPDGDYIYVSTNTGYQIVSAASFTVTATIPSGTPPGPAFFIGE